MTDSDTQEPLSNVSDSSFVILGQGSLPYYINDDLNVKPNSDSSIKSDINGAFTVFDSVKSSINNKFPSQLDENSLTKEDIQKKLNDLVKENYQLKETLNQNNLAIKSQLDTFFMWQQEVLKTHESHKQKFLETKDLILNLRAENSSLKKHLEDSLLGVSGSNDNEIYAQVNKRPEDLTKLKSKIEEYERMCNDLIEKNDALGFENQKLQEELKMAKTEILTLNQELETAGRENMFLKQKNSDSKDSNGLMHRSLPSSEARAQISNLLDQLEKEKSKVLKLKEELENVKSASIMEANSNSNPAVEINEYIDKLNDMDASLDMQNQRFNSLQSWISLAEKNVEENKISEGVNCNLISEINQLKIHLNQEENVSKEKQMSLQDLRKQFVKLLDDYKALQLNLDSIKRNDSITSEQCKINHSSLLSQLEEKNKELLLKEKECEELREVIKKLNLECEEIAAFKVQAEVFKTDFDDERKEKEKLEEERKRMIEYIQKMENTIEKLSQGSSTKKDSTKSPLESPGKEKQFVCPKCMMSLSSMERCLHHIEECVNDSFYP